MGIFKDCFRSKDFLGEVVGIELSLLVPNRGQPRREFSGEALKSLADSIRENGIIQPVCVRKRGEVYEIISGERRVRAARYAGLTQVPCIIMEVGDEQSAVLALIENIQRRDLSCFEEAQAIEKLITVYGLTQEEAAKRLGKAQSTIANKLRLLRFSEAERRILVTGNLSERQARAIIRISNENTRRAVIDRVVRESLNLEQTELLVEHTLAVEKAEYNTDCNNTNSNILSDNTIDNLEEKQGSKSENRKPKRPTFSLTAPSRLYINSLNALLKRIKSDNIPCEMSTEKSEEYYEYKIKFPIKR